MEMNKKLFILFAFAVLSIFLVAQVSATLTDNLAGYYTLDQLSGTTTDSLGILNGAISGNVIQGTLGIINTSYNFSGGTVNFGNSAYVSTQAFSFWINPSSVTGDHTIWFKGTGTTNDFVILTSGKIQYGFGSASGHVEYWTGNTTLSTGTWYYIAINTSGTGSGATQIYVNGNLENATYGSAGGGGRPSGSDVSYFGNGVGGYANSYSGILDEFGRWNRTLTPSEVQQLYNNGAGLSYPFSGYITLNYPGNLANVSNPSVNFNLTITNTTAMVNNLTIYINGTAQYTNTSGLNGTYLYTNSSLSDGYYSWNALAYIGGTPINSSTYYFTLDTLSPSINITYPAPNNSLINYQAINQNLQFNWTVSDSHLSSCWIDYGGSNHSVSCSADTTNINITSVNINHATFYANDTAGNLASLERSWNYKIFQNSESHNSSVYQTAYESYQLNLTANSSLTNVFLVYNGASHAMNYSSGLWSYSTDISNSSTGSKNLYYIFTYAGNNIGSANYTQTINAINFQLCGGGYTTPFLNISFKDETDLHIINASTPTSTFVYYLGTGTQNKTYTYVNTSNNYNYAFCASPNQTMYVLPYVQYKQGLDYPQRIWNPDITYYNNSLTSQILYLLGSTNGIYVTFQTINSAEQGIEGVVTTVTREISGSTVQIGKDTTGAGGGVTFWLNPDFTHTITFEKSGYDTYTISLTPTQSTYTITLSGAAPSTANYFQGVSYSIEPSGSFITQSTNYNFNYTITSNYWNLDSFGFSLLYPNGTIIGTEGSTANTGGTVSLDYNVTNESRLVMQYYYEINGTFVNGTRYWITYSANDFSLWRLFSDMSTAINSNNIFGVLSNDGGYFAKALISVIILIVGAGLLSRRYGLISEPAIMGIIFGIALLLNTLGFLPSISDFPVAGHTLDIGTLITIITAVMTMAFIFKEETY